MIDLKKNAWISPKGVWIDVPFSHGLSVCNEPEKFGLTKKQVEPAFVDDDEGGIFDEVIYELLITKRGWIRYVFLGPDGFIFDIKKLGNFEQNIIYDWSVDIIDQKIAVKNNNVLVVTRIDEDFKTLDLMKINSFDFSEK